jgi:hypothetical protein
MGISGEAKSEIQARLDAFEREHDVRVVYACESGSRAWGFASTDSDYDVRIIYAHPRDWYLSINMKRKPDAVDVPMENTPVGEVDLHAWDIRKALELFRGSNPSLMEWLHSPIIYRAADKIMAEWRALVDTCHSPKAAAYHYLNMAKSNAQKHLRGRDKVTLKQYFYVLRPVLAMRWIEAERGPVPVEFAKLVDAEVDDPELASAIEVLLRKKRAGMEADTTGRIPSIHNFVLQEIDRFDATDFSQFNIENDAHHAIEPLNALFRRAIGAARRAT